MILTWLGRAALYVCFVGAIGGVVEQLRAIQQKRASRALWWAGLALTGILAAVGVMEFALITHNFSLAYVAENNATFTPLLYSITGLWSALEGSLMLWVLLQIALTLGVLYYYRRDRADAVVTWATAVLFSIGAFFTALMIGPADPFLANAALVHQGAGPNALLQDNPLVAIHPPLLYLGFVGFSVPFAFAIAMLITGRVQERWPLEQRRWTMLAWGSLSIGIVLGAWWSYQVLGWGGFWGWDPVENAALLPWLTATAYIHSVIVQDRRGLFRVWNLSLAIATFALTILGTFFTRSGVLVSVHAFSSSTLGPLLIGLFFVVVVLGAGLLAWRGDRLRAPVGVDHPLSREGLFVANNILFVGFAIVVLLGTVFPLLYQAINGTQVTVGSPYFASVAAPLSVVLLLLMAIAPLVGWRSADAKVLWGRMRVSAWSALAAVVVLLGVGVRRPAEVLAVFLSVLAAGAALRTLRGALVAAIRRGSWRSVFRSPTTGGMIVHVGVVVLALGIVTSTTYVARNEVTLATGQRTVVDGQLVTFSGFRSVKNALESATQLRVSVDGHQLRPAVTTYNGRNGQTVGTPAIDSNLARDVYVTFDAVGGNGSTSGAQVQNHLPAGSVVLGVTVEPLLAWLWLGGLIIGLGSGLSFFRRRYNDEVTP
ncbi:MAG TPA: cytochrome c-type biogenesis CcmF C-terminal domain-containing protein [Acidimicrobiales bacterium]|nr:cytochrome c-type biogenesis CcmF C-terminal domain-containing protein [Acidimicrobiales bacterium]